MVRRDRVRDRTDRRDRDVRFVIVFSHLLSSSFVVSDEMVLVSLSRPLFKRNCVTRGKQRRERERRKNPRDHHHVVTLLSL